MRASARLRLLAATSGERPAGDPQPFPRRSGGDPGTAPLGSTLKPLHGLRIVVAEDEAIIALELELILDELGAEVVAIAGTGEEAVDLVGQYLPDIVTMDIRLAGAIDGIAAATEILRHHRIRSLFVTAYSEPSIVERAQAARPIGWVQKPFRGHTILAALAPFLATRG